MSQPKSSRVTLCFGGLGVACLAVSGAALTLDAPVLLLAGIALALVGVVLIFVGADHGGTRRNAVCFIVGLITFAAAFFFGVLQTST